jgi:hypothetical protein
MATAHFSKGRIVMNKAKDLTAARDALDALETRRTGLIAAVENAKAAVAAAEAERGRLIRLAAAGDRKATRDAIRSADDTWRDSQISLQIEEAKVTSVEQDIEHAKVDVMRARAQALSDDLRNALGAEAKAFDVFMVKIRDAQAALRAFQEAEHERAMAHMRALQHNNLREVQRVAYPSRPEQNVWQPPRPVMIIQEGAMVSSTFDTSGELIQAVAESNPEQDDTSVLAMLRGGSNTFPLGDVCTASLNPGGWKVWSLQELASHGSALRSDE